MCRDKTLRYHSLEKEHPLLDETDKEKVRKHYIEVVLIPSSVFFFLSCFLCILLCAISNNLYYVILCSVIMVLYFVSMVQVTMALFMGKFHIEEFSLRDHFSCEDLVLGIDIRNDEGTRSSLQIVKFNSRMCLLFCLYVILVFGVSLGLVVDKYGPPSGQSSCTSDFNSDGTNAYNPVGYFTSEMEYSDNIVLKFCPMDQTYANPTLNDRIIGYLVSPLDPLRTGACDTALPAARSLPQAVNGYVDTDRCEGSYPSPVLGVGTPITETTYGSSYLLCSGNMALPMCINPNTGNAFLPVGSQTCDDSFRLGMPKKICPRCLPGYRSWTGDHSGPDLYSHCGIYNPSLGYSPFCLAFCPRMGLMEYARYDDVAIIGAVVISSIHVFIWMCYYIASMILQVSSAANAVKVNFN
jgi:hypothetical protein